MYNKLLQYHNTLTVNNFLDKLKVH